MSAVAGRRRSPSSPGATAALHEIREHVAVCEERYRRIEDNHGELKRIVADNHESLNEAVTGIQRDIRKALHALVAALVTALGWGFVHFVLHG